VQSRITSYRKWLSVSAGALAASLVLTGAAVAQTTTASIRGQAAPGAAIVARNTETGFTSRATAGPDGSYGLPGLQPGSYAITATTAGESLTETVTIQIGQTADLDLLPTDDDADTVEGVVVTAAPRTAVEVKTSEVATNVSQAQIQNLPQGNRNFLNFAALAPGVRTSTDPLKQNFSAGGNETGSESLGSSQTNVFIDGVSLKSNVQKGGLVGQDTSRGNPFSQLAVREFRVATSNFKAEYEQAGTSVITAVTRSGTNRFRGEVFGFFTDESLSENDFLTEQRGDEKPDLSRKQYGFSLGGPIIRDRLHFFGAYEVNDQVRANSVTAGGSAALRALVPGGVTQYEGTFESPFREDLFFGRIDFQINDQQTLEFSASYRDESDIRSFGGQTSREAGEEIINQVTTFRAQHNFDTDRFLNEASFDYREAIFQPTAANPNLIGREYQGVIRIGGRDTSQNVSEKAYTFRNNITFTDFAWRGSHIIKAGVKVSRQQYGVEGGNFVNPLFTFINDPARNLNFSFPAEARFGVGDASVDADNTQFGAFIQDDWEVNEHLTLNLGLRYDYETNANNNDYVTPANAVTALRGLEATLANRPGNFFDADDYISTGDNREPFKKAIQPRIGFSYDLNADERTVFFGGYGRFYDRTLFRNAAEEQLFRTFALREFFFSNPNGAPRSDRPNAIVFRPEYLSREGLNTLIAQNTVGRELRVVKNDQEPPYTDQFSVGVRQRIAMFNTSATLTHQRGYNEIAYYPANRNPTPNASGFFDFIPVSGGFGNVIASNDERKTKYTALFLFGEKPYTEDSGWGVSLALTFAKASMKGFEFNFDRPNVAAAPFVPNAADEDYRAVFTSINRLPYDFRLSTFITVASGSPFYVVDARQGFGGNVIRLGNFGNADDFRQVDARLSKEIDLPSDAGTVEFIAEVFNLFNTVNYIGYDNFIPPEGNPNFGKGNAVAAPRSFQLGLRYRY
jgi:hypothetical protein